MLDERKLQKLGMQLLQTKLHYKMESLKKRFILDAVNLASGNTTVEEILSTVHDSMKSVDYESLQAEILDKATRY